MSPSYVTPSNNISKPKTSDILSKLYGQDLIDYISVLKQFDTTAAKSRYAPNTLPSLALSAGIVDLVFMLCSAYDLPSEVKYVALEIFDRFLSHHYIALTQNVLERSTNPQVVQKHWWKTCKLLQQQSLLRVLCCIQLASKAILQPKALSTKILLKEILDAGQCYTMSSIFKSEIRIFKALDCKIPLHSPLSFINTLLEGIQRWTNVQVLYPICEKVLDVTFRRREEIYLRYFWLKNGRWERTLKDRLNYAAVELDYFLLASSVILAAVRINPHSALSVEEVARILSELTDLAEKDMVGLAAVISQVILNS